MGLDGSGAHLLKTETVVLDSPSGVRGAVKQSAQSRKNALIERFIEFAEDSNDLQEIRQVCLDALKATQLVRGPKPEKRSPQDVENRAGYAYVEVPDHTIRLNAANLLAEIYGLKGSKSQVEITANDNRVQISVDQRIGELYQAGVKPEELRRELLAVTEEAERAMTKEK